MLYLIVAILAVPVKNFTGAELSISTWIWLHSSIDARQDMVVAALTGINLPLPVLFQE